MQQVKSKQRVANHGEVFTDEREVKAMLDLVVQESERIDSRFLEPACGDGNFLVEILCRKLAIVQSRYACSQLEYERYALLAISSLYGVDILLDNVQICRERLLRYFNDQYSRLFGVSVNDNYVHSIRFIVNRNIIWGDALDLKVPAGLKMPIIFSEWSLVNGSMLKRRDYMLSFLIDKSHQLELFSDANDLAHIAEPVRDYPLVYFCDLGQEDAAQNNL